MLTLWATCTVTVEMIHTAKSKNIPLPKTLNQPMGKISNCQTGFNDATWGGSTHAYVRGINANLSNKNFNKIIDRAMAFARKSRHATGVNTETKTKTSAGDTIELDKRVLIKDKPCLDDEEYDGADEED